MYVVRTRRAHQVTVAALYILKHHAYNHYSTANEQGSLDFQQWSNFKGKACPHFQYWATVMKLELCILTFVRFLRSVSFTMYFDALTELASWFFALEHTNYVGWIPVHLKDMAELSIKQPDVLKEFNDGKFVVHKTRQVFSSIPIDQAHEQKNALIKGDGGAVGLTSHAHALQHWMVVGPEVSRIVEEFHEELDHCVSEIDTHYRDQTPTIQANFGKNVLSLVSVMEDLGNPFEEEGTNLLVLSSKDIVDHAAVETTGVSEMQKDLAKNSFRLSLQSA